MAASEARNRAVIRAPRRPDHGRSGAVTVRLAELGEIDEVASIFAPSLAPYRGHAGDWILAEYLAELVKVHDRAGVAETHVALDEGRIVGSVAFYSDVALEGWSNLPGGWTGLRALAVHPAARGRGAGRLLVERCLERARAVGALTLGLHTIDLLVDAVRLYQAMGFVRCPEFDLRAADVFGGPDDDPMVGRAFRYDLGASGPRTVTEPGVTT
jgi:GNAT superfamily N-acetyltransferase